MKSKKLKKLKNRKKYEQLKLFPDNYATDEDWFIHSTNLERQYQAKRFPANSLGAFFNSITS